MICHLIRFRGDDSFYYWLEKKKKRTRYLLFAYVGVDFRVKRCTVGMHNAMAQIGLETNSSRDVSLEMEKGPLLQ